MVVVKNIQRKIEVCGKSYIMKLSDHKLMPNYERQNSSSMVTASENYIKEYRKACDLKLGLDKKVAGNTRRR